MLFHSNIHWKYILLWSAFLVDNILEIEFRQVQWNMSYSNEKDWNWSSIEDWVFTTEWRAGWVWKLNWRLSFYHWMKYKKKCFKKSLTMETHFKNLMHKLNRATELLPNVRHYSPKFIWICTLFMQTKHGANKITTVPGVGSCLNSKFSSL